MKFSDKFKNIQCINLNRRPDRWEESLDEFRKFDLNVKRFSAHDGRYYDLGFGEVYNGEFAGTCSHTSVLKWANSNKWENVLILEDDIVFSEDFIKKSEKGLDELPEDWDILFFGGNHVGGYIQYSNSLIRCFGSYALQCYAVNNKAYNTIISYMDMCISEVSLSKTKFHPSVAADYFMAKTHQHLNVYSLYPNVTWQRKSFSDLQQDVVFYDFLKP